MLEIKDYSYSYTDNENVIENLDLQVNSGEIMALVGANGVGKTTLIKSIVGINDDYQGLIKFKDYNLIRQNVEYKRTLAYVADQPTLLEYLTGRQYLNFIADIFDVSWDKRNESIEKYINKFNLDGVVDNLISSYSHGNKQKLAIVAALIHEPELLVLDEPFVGLDPSAIKELKTELIEWKKRGCTIIFSTHMLAMIEGIYDKVLLMKRGKSKTVKSNKSDNLEALYMEFSENA